MTRRSSRARAPILLMLVALALGALIYWEFQQSDQPGIDQPSVATAALQNSLPDEPALGTPDRSEFAEIIERPVFSPGRRPGRPPELEGEETSTDLDLVGIVIVDGRRVALLKSGDSPLRRVTEGEEISGWMAIRIGVDHVSLERDVETLDLYLDYTEPAPATIRTQPKDVNDGGSEEETPEAQEEEVTEGPDGPANEPTNEEPAVQ